MSPKIALPSNIRFGWFLTLVFCIASIYCYFMLIDEAVISTGLASAAITTALLTVFKPSLLSPLNRTWALLGETLGRIISPLILGLIFFLILTPTALIGRALGRDELRLKRKLQSSYWIDRSQPSPKGDSFKNQY